MLTLSTPSDQLMKELADEHEKAKYWLKKHYGGEQGYEAMRDLPTEEVEIETPVAPAKANQWSPTFCRLRESQKKNFCKKRFHLK